MVVDGTMEKSAAITEGAFIYQNSRKTHMGEVGSNQMGKDGPMARLSPCWSVFPHVTNFVL